MPIVQASEIEALEYRSIAYIVLDYGIEVILIPQIEQVVVRTDGTRIRTRHLNPVVRIWTVTGILDDYSKGTHASHIAS